MITKKILALVLALVMLASMTCLAGCSPKEPAVTDEPPADGGEVEVVKSGTLTFNNTSAEDLDAKVAEEAAQGGMESPYSTEYVYFDTLNAMLLALQAGQIDCFVASTAVAEYIVAGNDALTIVSDAIGQEVLSMAVLEDKAELLTLLNDAIAALQADGTIDALIKDYVDGATPNAEVTPIDLPVIAGADTIKVAVTGDLPPIDYTTADGKPAGFNVALLSAISEKAGVNIELISIDSGARVISLTSGRADAVFWMRSTILPDGTVDATSDVPAEVALTDPYYTDTDSVVVMK